MSGAREIDCARADLTCPASARPRHRLSWSDTTASTIGRLLGRHSPPLPAHVPLLPFLPFAQRKSLAGFSAAALTGFLIAVGFWWSGSHGGWCVLSAGAAIAGRPVGFWLTAVVLGLGGAVVEALGEWRAGRHVGMHAGGA